LTATFLRLIGIDPGTRQVGYGVVECRGRNLICLESGCLSPPDGPLPGKLLVIYQGLREVILRLGPSRAAVETVFAGRNPRTAIAIGEGRGVALLAAAEQGLEVAGYEPALVKRAVAGSGRADKEQVRSMVRVLLALPELPATDHEADALALAIALARHLEKAALTGASVPAGPARLRPSRRQLPDFVLRQLPAAAGRRAGRRGK
jgi:crossover junction endodeoxyribonuclease RuvC